MKIDVAPSTRPIDNDSSSASPHAQPTESLHRAADHFAEVREYASHYIAAKIALLKLTARRAIMLAGLAVVGLLVVGAMVVSATVLLLLGAANAIGSAFNPPKPWVGQMTIGLVFIGGIVIATFFVSRKWNAVSRRATIEAFEQRHREQQARVGQDAAQRAAEGRTER